MFQERPVVESRVVQPYTKYHYALLMCRGIGYLFDLMRYENAFFCRRVDVTGVKAAMTGLHGITQPMTVLLCKYGEGRHGGWTLGRLLSDQHLTELRPEQVYEYDADMAAPRPTGRLKFANEVVITGLVGVVVDSMFKNRAMPATEGDAHKIEQVPYNPDQSISVRLKNFASVAGWIW